MAEYNLGKVKGADGNGIKDITKTDTVGLNDIYTITMDDDTEYTFIVTNGQDGSAGDIDDNVTQSSSNPVKSSGIYTALASKQATLVSGTNIKTINNNSLLGSGNLDIQGSNVDIVTSWESTLSDSKVASEKLVKNTIDTKITGSKVTSWSGTVSDSNIPSEKLVKDTIDGLNIPTKISDLTNDSDFIETSSTSGLIKNDGTIDTSAYITSSALSNYIQKSQTSGLVKNDGSIDTSSYLTTGTASSTYVPKSDIVDNLTTNDSTKVLSAKQGKALADLIGDAITYINQ